MNSPTERNTATEMGTATDRRPAEGTGGGSGVRIGVLVTALLAACFAFQLNASMLSPALKNIEDTLGSQAPRRSASPRPRSSPRRRCSRSSSRGSAMSSGAAGCWPECSL